MTLIGIYKVAKSLSGEKVAVLSSAFYIVIPLFAFFDRQALMESSLTAAGIWTLYFLLKSFETKNIKYPIFLGLVLGIGIFIKLSALVFFISVILILIYKRRYRWATASALTGLMVLVPLIFQKTFWDSFGSNSRFMLSIPEVLSFPLPLWINNISNTINVSFFHLTPLVFALSIYGIYLSLKDKKAILPIFFLINIVLVLFMGRSLNPRYLAPYLATSTIFCSYAILSFKKNFVLLIGSLAILIPIAVTSLLFFSPLSYFNLMDRFTSFSQKSGYVTDWTSGYGVPETVNYINGTRIGKNIIVAVRLDAGNPESAMFTYFNGVNGVQVTYLDPQLYGPELLKQNCIPSQVPVYFVARDSTMNGLEKFFTETARFGKPEGNRYISIHTLKKCS